MGRSRVALTFCAGFGLLGFIFPVASRFFARDAPQVFEPSIARVSAAPEIPTGPIHLKAAGHDFVWRFSFRGEDETFGTADDLVVDKIAHLPIHRDVHLVVESEDFVYSFHVPKLKLRHVAVPELSYPIDFRTEHPGHFTAVMDTFCGGGVVKNDDMGRIVVERREAFEAWYLKSYRETRT